MKKSKRKAAKVQAMYDNRERDWSKLGEPGPLEEPAFELIEPVAEVQQRWEMQFVPNAGDVGGEYVVYDHHTHLQAPYRHLALSATVALENASELNAGTLPVTALMWEEPVTRAVVHTFEGFDHNRFWSIALDGEWAMFDRITRMVHPFQPGAAAEDVVDEVTLFNSSPESELDECVNDVEEHPEDGPHWISREQWIAPPPEDKGDPRAEPEESDPEPGPTPTEVLPPLRVLVISSAGWSWNNLMADQLRALAARSGVEKRGMVVVTSGSPYGAEVAARGLAVALGWQVETIRDEGIPHAQLDTGLAYIMDGSDGAETALNIALQARVPMHVTRETPPVKFDPWASR